MMILYNMYVYIYTHVRIYIYIRTYIYIYTYVYVIYGQSYKASQDLIRLCICPNSWWLWTHSFHAQLRSRCSGGEKSSPLLT